MNLSNSLIKFTPRIFHPYLTRIYDSPLGNRMAKGAFWSLVSALIARTLALLSSIVVAQMLGREAFGELGIIQSTMGMFQTLAGFGLGLTATKYIAELRLKDPDRAGRLIVLSKRIALVTGAAMAISLFIIAPLLARRALAAPDLSELLRISTFMLFWGALNGAQVGVLQGFETFKAIARINLISGVLTFILTVAGVYLGGLKGAVLGLTVSMALTWFLNSSAIKSEACRAGVPLTNAGYWQERRVLFNFSLPAVLSWVIVSPTIWACNVMLVNQANGYAEMGIYNAAHQWRNAILFLPGAIGAIVLPVLSSLQDTNNRSFYKRTLWLTLMLNGSIALFAAMLVSVFSSNIMMAYGSEFADGATLIVILSFSGVLISLNDIVGQAIASLGKMWHGLMFNSLWALAFISGAYWLIPLWGAKGLALAFMGAYILHTSWQACYLWKAIE